MVGSQSSPGTRLVFLGLIILAFLTTPRPKGGYCFELVLRPPQLAFFEWPAVLPEDFDFPWFEIWDTEQSRKESELIWKIAHKAVVVNEWRGEISPTIPQACPTCASGVAELVIHRFWSCPQALRMWQFTSDILGLFTSNLLEVQWRHAVFGDTIQFNNLAVLRHSTLLPSGTYGLCGIKWIFIGCNGTMVKLLILFGKDLLIMERLHGPRCSP